MPWAFIQAMRRFTSAMTSGPIPSPASRRRLWVGMVRSLVGNQRELLSSNAGFRKLHASRTTVGETGAANWRLGGRRGPRRSLDLVFRLGVGRIAIDGPIARGLSPLDLFGEFNPCRRQVQCQGLVVRVLHLNRQAIALVGAPAELLGV